LIEASSGTLYAERSATDVRARLLRVPLRAIELFFSSAGTASQDSPGLATSTVVTAAREFLENVPGGGALMRNLVSHVVQATGYDSRLVHGVIRRNFRSKGMLVWL
jgi:hypothetical protein